MRYNGLKGKMVGVLQRWTRRRESEKAAALYGALVAQARQPGFYRHYGVPDSVDGRFELIALHAFLLMHRLKGQGAGADALSQSLFDTMFRDLDGGLREMGVGDLVVGKRIKHMAESFYGRVVAYEKGLAATDRAVLREALDYNLYGTSAPGSAAQLDGMADYLRRSAVLLEEQALDALLEGRVDFIPLQEGALS